jgi:hypothetical protein
MDGIFYTLHEFLTHTENVTYLLIVASLFGIAGFWYFLNKGDED